ncbi:hypothetical protein EGH22_19495 [Halomicroarcula sp. F28]|uniref:hypothetical protein n=1 Tax=Haloarcula salinisoli TaxID=2487746 RepID=UPI001C73A978|nr:hypothetical protein [Halomicroarcula salinisoli]MBX0288518.1 hypothetical protein [Halomicroarcula salinisoli]
MSITGGLLGAGTMIVGLFVLGQVVGRWLRQSEELTSTQQSVHDNLLLALPLLVIMCVTILFRQFPVVYTLLGSEPDLATALLNGVISGTVAVLGLAGAWRGLRPYRNARPMIREELWERNRVVVATWCGLIIFVIVATELILLYSQWAPEVLVGLLSVAIAGLYLSGFVALPAHCPYIRFGIRRPTAAERDRLEQAYAHLGIPLPDSIEITVNDDTERLVVLQDGERRVLALSDSLLPSVDDDTLSVGLAHVEGRGTHRVSPVEKGWLSTVVFAAVVFVWCLFMLALDSEVPEPVIVGAILSVTVLGVVAVVLGTKSQDRIHLADEYTVAHADESLVADVYTGETRFGFIQRRQSDVPDRLNELMGYLLPEPTIEERLEHIGHSNTPTQQSNSG